MAILPLTGSTIKMGSVYRAYTNVNPGTPGNATPSGPYTGGQNIKLSAVLGAGFGGVSSGSPISFSQTFGGKTTPHDYT